MATTYLELTNMLLRELNEVALTAANFDAAIGVQQHVKDSVNKAYFDIVIDEPKWPFLAVATSGTTNPMYGNKQIETVAGTRWYELKPSSDSIKNDYGAIDWDNFYLTTEGVTGETAPYEGENLRFMTTEDWKDYRRVNENLDAADTQTYGKPNVVIRSPDSRMFGLSPIPDKVYNIWFYAYVQPTKLNLYSDEVLIPDMYANVLLAKARYYIWQFKDNPQAAAFALEDYKFSYRQMRSNLMENQPVYLKDDRTRFV